MDIRVTQFGSEETASNSYELPEHRDTDSSFEQQMLEQMRRQHQQQQQTAAAASRRATRPMKRLKVPPETFERRPRAEEGEAAQGDEAARISRAMRPTRRLNVPPEAFERKPASQAVGRDGARERMMVVPRRPIVNPEVARSQSLFQRYQAIKEQATPRVRDSDGFDAPGATPDHPISIEDSPLSRKSASARGTPATGHKSARARAREKVLSWRDSSDEFDEQSILASTPAFPRFNSLGGHNERVEESSLMVEPTNIRGVPIDSSPPKARLAPYKERLEILKQKEELARKRKEVMVASSEESKSVSPEAVRPSERIIPLPPKATEALPSRREDSRQNDKQTLAKTATRSQTAVEDKPIPSVEQHTQSEKEADDSIYPTPPPEEPAKTTSNHTKPDELNSKPQSTSTSRPTDRRLEELRQRVVPDTPPSKPLATNLEDSIHVLRQLSRSVSRTPPLERQQRRSSATEDRAVHSQRSIEPVRPPAMSSGKMTTASGASDIAGQLELDEVKDPKTPKPVGAWIDTPVAQRQKPNVPIPPRSILKSQSSYRHDETAPEKKKYPEQPTAANPSGRDEPTKPTLPISALSAVVSSAADNDDGLGDATIASLEGLMGLSPDEEVTRLWDFADISVRLPAGIVQPSDEDRRAIRELLEERITNDLPFSRGLPPSDSEKRLIREIVEQRIARSAAAAAQTQAQPGGSDKDNGKSKATAKATEAAPPSSSALTPRRKERIEEELQLQKMSQHVASMSTRTRSLSAGLNRLERHMASAAPSVSSVGSSIRRALVVVDDDAAAALRAAPRPTRLGYATAFALLWLLLELLAYLLTARPVFATHAPSAYGPFAPARRPAFALTRFVLGAPLELAAGAWDRFAGAVLLLLEGDDGGEGGEVAAATATRSALGRMATRTVEMVGETLGSVDYSMDNDEVLV